MQSLRHRPHAKFSFNTHTGCLPGGSPRAAEANAFHTWASDGEGAKQPFVSSQLQESVFATAPTRLQNKERVFATEPTCLTSDMPPFSGRWQHGPEGSLISQESSYHLVASSDGCLPGITDHGNGAPEAANTWRHLGLKLITSFQFQVTMALLILANALVIGLETDNPEFEWWGSIEMIFLVVFSIELLFRLSVYGLATYFDTSGADFVWNMFDFLVVSVGFLDIIVSLTVHEGGGGAESIFRIIRLLRILRIFRIVRFLKHLYMLAFGFALAAMAIFWVAVLMAFMLYVCAVILVRTVGRDSDNKFLHANFSTIPMSMLTLFELMSAPDLTPYHDVMGEYPLMSVFLIAFIIFGSFGMIALLTGVIGEAMFDKNQLRVEEQQLDRERSRLLIVEQCGLLFDTIDENHDGNVSKYELKDKLHQIVDFFESEGMDCYEEDLDVLMGILDFDKSGKVNKDEFCHGILQMAEGVRPLMIMETSFSVLYLKNKMEELSSSLTQQHESAGAERNRLSNSLGKLESLVRTLLAEKQPPRGDSRLPSNGLGERIADTLFVPRAHKSNAEDPNKSGQQEVSSGNAELMLAVASLRSEVRDMMGSLRPSLPMSQAPAGTGESVYQDLMGGYLVTAQKSTSRAAVSADVCDGLSQPLESLTGFLAESFTRLAAQQQGLLHALEAFTPRGSLEPSHRIQVIDTPSTTLDHEGDLTGASSSMSNTRSPSSSDLKSGHGKDDGIPVELQDARLAQVILKESDVSKLKRTQTTGVSKLRKAQTSSLSTPSKALSEDVWGEMTGRRGGGQKPKLNLNTV